MTQLVDRLQERADRVKLIEPATPLTFALRGYTDPVIRHEDTWYYVAEEAMESFLNMLRVPIKYYERLVVGGEFQLAELNINFWLKDLVLSFLIDDSTVTQFFEKKKCYVPSLVVNDTIVDHFQVVNISSWEVTDDGFQAVYVSDSTVSIDDIKYKLGIRVLFNECFNEAPRFDAVLYSEECNLFWTLGVPDRKFRSARYTLTNIIDQIHEFIDLSLDNLKSEFEDIEIDSTLICYRDFLTDLCTHLRLSGRVHEQLLSVATMVNYPMIEIAELINAALATLDLRSIRDIQVAVTQYALSGRFK